MLSCTSSNKLTRGKNQRVPENLDNPKNGQTLKRGLSIAAFGNLLKVLHQLGTSTLPILMHQDKHLCQHRVMVFIQYAYQ